MIARGQAAAELALSSRVTGFGRILAFWADRFSLGRFLKLAEVAKILGLLLSADNVVHKF
jgi:hypothetical protein